MRRRYLWATLLPALLLGCLASPSSARVRVGVFLGPGWWWGPPYYDPYWYDSYWSPYGPYPYDPYYAPYGPSYYYEPVQQKPREETRSGPDNSRHDLTYIEGQIARAQEQVEYDYEDGDITKDQYRADLRRLAKIRDEARAEAKANGGTITGDQEKDLLRAIRGEPLVARPAYESSPTPNPTGNLKMVTDRIARLRALADKKLADGDITKAQHKGITDYLGRTERQVKSQATGGTLSADQEEAVMQQLNRTEESLQSNFIIH